MSDWKEYKLSDIVDIKHGYAFKGEFFSDEPTNNILVTPGNFKIGGGFKDDKLKYYEGDIPNDYILSHEDIIVTMTDLSKQADTLGFSAKVPNDNTKVFLHNQRIGLLQFKNSAFSSEFLYWLMRAEHYQKFVAGSATGATVKHTSPTKIRAFKFKAPSDDVVRKKIAKILSNYDDLIENNLKRIKLLEESARLTYEEWFLRFRVDGEKLEIDSKTGLPFGWKNNRFDYIFNINNGYAFKSEDYVDAGVPILRTRDYSKTKWIDMDQPIYISEELSKKYVKYYIQDYDLMLIMVGASIGNYGIVLPKDKGSLQNQNQWAIRIKEGFETYTFFKLLMMEDLIQNLLTRKTGAARDFFRASFLRDLKIIIPDQNTINKFNKIIEPVFEEINNLSIQNQLLKEAKDILLPRLMTGMIDVEGMEIAI